MNTIGKRKVLKQLNRKRILNLLRNAGELSVAELAKKANLSKPTIMKIMHYYIDKGLVVISGKGSSTEEGGKKPNIYRFNENGGYAIGVAITASKLKSIITNLKGDILFSIEFNLKTNEDLDSVIDKIVESYNLLVEKAKIDSSKIVGMGVGIYGLTDYDKGIFYYSPHYTSWGKNILMRDKIKKRIPKNVNVFIDNLPRFQVYAEKAFGAAKKAKSVVSIVAGYGLGSGIIIDNDIVRGYHKILGEVGHMIINPYEEMRCACGGKGCFEIMVSVDRLKKLIETKKDYFPDSILIEKIDNGSLKDLPPEVIFEAYKGGDSLAVDAMQDIINWFAVGLSNIMLIYDPQVVILHGVYTKAGNDFLKKIKNKINSISLSGMKKETAIKFSELGDKAGVLGAAAYVINKFFE